MCFDHDSVPPITPIAGGALDAGALTLTSEDGTAFGAFRAVAAQPTGAGIVILPDVRGLHHFFEELALRFAEHGVDAIAIDYFARTAGLTGRGPEFEYQPHVARTRWSTLAADIRTAIATLRAPEWDDGRAPDRVFATGFCMGGRLTSLAGTLGLGLAGLIPFYGWPVGGSGNGAPAPADVAGMIASPVLAIYGGADQGIGPEVREAYDVALTAAGVPHRTIVYPGAPHSFFDRKEAEFAAESAAAWEATLGFIRTGLLPD